MKKNIINYGGTILGIFLFVALKEIFIELGMENIWAILASVGIIFVLVALIIYLNFYILRKKKDKKTIITRDNETNKR